MGLLKLVIIRIILSRPYTNLQHLELTYTRTGPLEGNLVRPEVMRVSICWRVCVIVCSLSRLLVLCCMNASLKAINFTMLSFLTPFIIAKITFPCLLAKHFAQRCGHVHLKLMLTLQRMGRRKTSFKNVTRSGIRLDLYGCHSLASFDFRSTCFHFLMLTSVACDPHVQKSRLLCSDSVKL